MWHRARVPRKEEPPTHYLRCPQAKTSPGHGPTLTPFGDALTPIQEYRTEKSHAFTAPPIRFIGLLDTVGALGIPHLDVGVHLE